MTYNTSVHELAPPKLPSACMR